jgi:hypothetical protein
MPVEEIDRVLSIFFAVAQRTSPFARASALCFTRIGQKL